MRTRSACSELFATRECLVGIDCKIELIVPRRPTAMYSFDQVINNKVRTIMLSQGQRRLICVRNDRTKKNLFILGNLCRIFVDLLQSSKYRRSGVSLRYRCVSDVQEYRGSGLIPAVKFEALSLEGLFVNALDLKWTLPPSYSH